MAGTRIGGLKVKKQALDKDPDFFARIGRAGGLAKKTRPSGFATISKERHLQISSAAGKLSAPGLTKKLYLERVKKYAEKQGDN